jgi:xylulokinase
MECLLGIDVGTTSMKGMLINKEGENLYYTSVNYELITMKDSFVELEVENYWEAFKKITKNIIYLSKIDPIKILAISISSQGETLICLDENNKPLRNAIVWLDNRSTCEAEEIKKAFNIKNIYELTGQPEITSTWTATKILWLKKNEKQIFEKTSKYLLVGDYLNYKLTGGYFTDRSLCSSTLYFNIQKDNWLKEMLNFIGIKEGQLPLVKNSGEYIGNITKEASIETGLSKNTAVITGALDQMASSIGAGNIHSKIITETTGTCLAMCVNINGPISYNEKYKIPCHCSALEKEYSLIFWSQTAGAILEWFKKNICNNESTYKKIDKEAAMVDAGSDGLILLPHFNGLAVPHFNPLAKGVLFGIALNHTRAHIARAIMESVGFMLKEHIEVSEKMGINITEIRSLGGGAKSSLWNQIKADITKKEIVTLENPETSVLGVAMLAGVAIGLFKNPQDACNRCVRTKDRYFPNDKNFSTYEKNYETYKKLYSNVCSFYES